MELSLDLSKEELTKYLQSKSMLEAADDIVELEKPGEGNMNRVVRVISKKGSLILKQATDFVNKYPDIPAPIERINVEQQWYQLTAELNGIEPHLPQIIGFDENEHLLILEDLGQAADYTYLYQKDKTLSSQETEALIDGLYALHTHSFTHEIIQSFPQNLALRKLNHQHIFQFPLMEDNGLDLDTITPGLQAAALTFKRDPALKAKAVELGKEYLSNGRTLLHGDYYPGSWLQTHKGFKIIDPEFCFFGPKEFDLGVLLAHLSMAQQPAAIRQMVLDRYKLAADQAILDAFEGIEIIRRIIGLAQLPLDLSLIEKEELLAYAYQKLMS